MRINPISFNSIKNFQPIKNNFQTNYLKQSSCDSVHFTGVKKAEEETISPKSIGIKVGEEMLKLEKNGNLNIQTISDVMNANSTHEIEIFNMKDCPDLPPLPGKVVAYMQPYYNDEDFSFASAELYLQDIDDMKTPGEKCDFIANNAHEFTHILQRAKNKNMNGILDYFRNMNAVQLISKIGFQALGEMLYIQDASITQDEEAFKKVSDEIDKGTFNYKDYAQDIKPAALIFNIGTNLALEYGLNVRNTRCALLEWIYNTSRDEEEAYEVTSAIYDRSPNADKDLRAKRVISKEGYKYMADQLEPYVRQKNQ
ncbi:hypothetical protein II906_00950 [bacterium]|nr:hypothetical protein [bacterium]